MKVALLSHGWPPDSLGGAEGHSRMLAAGLAARGHQVSVLARTRRPGSHRLALSRASAPAPYALWWLHDPRPRPRSWRESWDDPRTLRRIDRWLREEQPDAVHLGHLTGLGVSTGTVLAGLGIPYIMTVHDDWQWCARGQARRLDGVRCDRPDPTWCASCVPNQIALSPLLAALSALYDDLGGRRPGQVEGAAPPLQPCHTQGPLEAVRERIRRARGLLAGARVVHCPSHSMADRVRRVCPEAAIEVLAQPFRGRRAGLARRPGTPLRAVFLGTLLENKGLELLCALGPLVRGRVRIELIGPAPAHLDRDALRTRLQQSGLHWSGALPPERIPAALRTHHVLLVPSQWNENAPLVLREGAEAGLALVASHLGGIPEFAGPRGGILLPPDDAAPWARALLELASSQTALQAARAPLPGGPVAADVIDQIEAWLGGPGAAPAR